MTRRVNQPPRSPDEPSNICGDYGNLNRFNEPCKNWCAPGARACRRHLRGKGKAVTVKIAEGALNKALQDWGLRPGEVVDPGETFLALIAQSSRRVARYSVLLGQAVQCAAEITAAEDGRSFDSGVNQNVEDIFARGELAGLLAPEYELDMFGTRIKVGEQIRALTKLEAEERDRLAKWCQQAVAAGLEERRVRLAEQQGAQLAAVVRAFMNELNLTAEQRALAPAALRAAVNLVFGAGPLHAIDGEVVTSG